MILSVEFEEKDAVLDVEFEELRTVIQTDFGEVFRVVDPDSVPKYDGPYEITPSVNAKTIPTAQKLMKDDFTVEAIPYSEVSNLSNGYTVNIG